MFRSKKRLMRAWAAATAVFALFAPMTASGGQKYNTSGPWSRVLSKGPYKALPFKRVMIASKVDGVPIEVGYWRPNVPTGTRVPVIAVASPYFTPINPSDDTDMSSMTDDVRPLVENYLSFGYAVAGVSIRGSGQSGGCIEMFGPKETADIGTAMDWLGKASWSTGRIAVVGLSYNGAGAWEAAASGSRYVKAIVPAEGFVEARDVWYRKGRTSLGSVSQAAFLAWPARRIAPSTGPDALLERVKGAACPDLAKTALSYVTGQTIGGIDPIGYWRDRNHKPAIEAHYRGAILLPVGTADDDPVPHQVVPWTDSLTRRGVDVRQWIGPWNHSFPDGTFYDYHRWDWAEYLLHWLDHELKGVTSYNLGPAVQVMDNNRQWRYEDHFPPSDGRSRSLQPNGDATLRDHSTKPSSYQLVPLLSEWPYKHNSLGRGPVETAARTTGQDGAVFDLKAPSTGLRFSGVPHLRASVTPEGVTGSLSAYLYDVSTKGVETQLSWGTMSLEYRDGGTSPEFVTPGAPLDVSFDLEPTDAVIRPGHRLRLRVWQLDPETSFDTRPAPLILRVGPKTATALSIPVIVRSKPRTFDPVDSWGVVP